MINKIIFIFVVLFLFGMTNALNNHELSSNLEEIGGGLKSAINGGIRFLQNLINPPNPPHAPTSNGVYVFLLFIMGLIAVVVFVYFYYKCKLFFVYSMTENELYYFVLSLLYFQIEPECDADAVNATNATNADAEHYCCCLMCMWMA